MTRTHWNPAELDRLQAEYATTKVAELAASMGRTVKQIQAKTSRMGLKQDAEHRAPITGRPPAKRNAVLAVIEAAGRAGVDCRAIAAAVSGSHSAVLSAVSALAQMGQVYSVPRRFKTRYFVASVPRAEAEAELARIVKEEQAAREALKPPKRVKPPRAPKPANVQAKLAPNLCTKTSSSRVMREASFAKRLVKIAAKAAPVRVIASRSDWADTAPRITEQTKRVQCPAMPDRWAVTPPEAGGFSHLRPGQYAFGPASCAARAAA